MSTSSTPSLPKKRPGLVWAIAIFMFISAAWTLFSFYLIGNNAIPLTPEQQAYFSSLSTLDYGAAILGGLLNLAGAAALLFLRKVALPLFGAALSLNLIATIWNVMSKNWVEAIGTSGLIGALIGMGILAAICVYTRNLIQKGTLT